MKLANTYDSLTRTLIECIQNAIDGEADHVFVGIDLKNRRAYVADNGVGVDVFKFESALMSVGQTIKDDKKLGRFGLGLISPLNKCTSFTFISAPMPGGHSTRWRFDQREIIKQHKSLEIPRETVPTLPVLSQSFRVHATGSFAQKWRTIVSMSGLVQDKIITGIDLDEFEMETISKLGNAMRRQKVKIRVVLLDQKGAPVIRNIAANNYSGEKLSAVAYTGERGAVEIELYKATKRFGKRSGLVTVAEGNGLSSISIRDFTRQARMTGFWDIVSDPIEALSSGFFEGAIRSTGIALSPERTKFELNEGLRELYIQLGDWYEEHGRAQYENEREISRESRYQELGLKSQNRFQEILKRPENQRLLAALRGVVSVGRLGDGHVKPTSGRPGGEVPSPSTRVGQGGAGVTRTPSGDPRSPSPTSPQKGSDRPGDTPLGVLGPKGSKRHLVRNDSQGLWYEYSPLSSSPHLWEFDLELGVLTFNVIHPVWSRLDETKGKHTVRNDKWIMHLMEWVTLQVLQLLASYPDAEAFEQHRSFIDDQVRLYADMFITASR